MSLEEVLREFVNDVEMVHNGGADADFPAAVNATAANLAEDWPDLAMTYIKARSALALHSRLSLNSPKPMTVKKWLRNGESAAFQDCNDIDDIFARAGRLMDKACTWEILGDVVFIGDNDVRYGIEILATVTEPFDLPEDDESNDGGYEYTWDGSCGVLSIYTPEGSAELQGEEASQLHDRLEALPNEKAVTKVLSDYEHVCTKKFHVSSLNPGESDPYGQRRITDEHAFFMKAKHCDGPQRDDLDCGQSCTYSTVDGKYNVTRTS